MPNIVRISTTQIEVEVLVPDQMTARVLNLEANITDGVSLSSPIKSTISCEANLTSGVSVSAALKNYVAIDAPLKPTIAIEAPFDGTSV